MNENKIKIIIQDKFQQKENEIERTSNNQITITQNNPLILRNNQNINQNKQSFHIKNSIISAKESNFDNKKKKIEETTQTLITNLIRILKNDKLRELSFGFIHNLSYNITIEKGGEYFTQEFQKNLELHLDSLYENCLNFLKISKNEFIRKIIDSYNDYINKISIIQKTLMYYEKNYLFKKNLKDVKTNSKLSFQKVFITDNIIEIFRKFVSNQVLNDRNNIFIDKILINDLSTFLWDLNEEIYCQLIEKSFLEQTKEFYEKDYLKNIELKNSIEYSNYIKNRLAEETQRITDLNLVKSKEKILEIFKNEMIEKFFNDKERIITFMMNIFKSNDKPNLLLLQEISIFNLTEDFYKIFAKAIEIYLNEIIKEKFNSSKTNSNVIKNLTENLEKNEKIEEIPNSIQNFKQTKFNSKTNLENNKLIPSLSVIDDLLQFLDKIENFKKDLNISNKQNYLNLIKQHTQYSINHKNYPFFIAKVLAKQIDHNFKHFFKNRISQFEVNNYIERVVNIFRMIDDKDIFEIEYRKLLQSRLLNNFFFEDIDAKILGKLKLECGAVFTHRCEVMISDIKDSFTSLENYFNSVYSHKKNKNFEVDFNVKILTTGNWIVNVNENLRIEKILKFCETSQNLRFLKILENFNSYYTKFFHNKILSYNLFLSTCEVHLKNKMKNYQISMNIFHAIFCIYIKESREKLNLLQIFEFFGISDLRTIILNIIPILKSGLINTSTNLIFNDDNLNEFILKFKDKNLSNLDSNMKNELVKLIFEFNKYFSFKHQSLKISNFANSAFLDRFSANESKSEESVNAERKYLIESNIIRIMKSKQTINHNDLTNEVIKSIQQSFVADLNLIKQRIECLIERGYIKRADNNYNTYVYNS